jgi:hypothetical protein
VFNEVKERPLYMVKEEVNFDEQRGLHNRRGRLLNSDRVRRPA